MHLNLGTPADGLGIDSLAASAHDGALRDRRSVAGRLRLQAWNFDEVGPGGMNYPIPPLPFYHL